MNYTVSYKFNARWYVLYLIIIWGVLTLGWLIFPRTVVANELFTIIFSAIVYWILSSFISLIIALMISPVIIEIGPKRVFAIIVVTIVAFILMFVSCIACLYITEYLIGPFEVVGLGSKIIIAICFTAFMPKNKSQSSPKSPQ